MQCHGKLKNFTDLTRIYTLDLDNTVMLTKDFNFQSDEAGFPISRDIHARTSGNQKTPKETGCTGSTPRTIQILYQCTVTWLQTVVSYDPDKFLFILQKSLPSASVQCFFFLLPIICYTGSNFQGTVVLPRSRTDFCQASKLSNFISCSVKLTGVFVNPLSLILVFRVYTFNVIDTCGYQIFWCFQVRAR